MLAFAHIQKTAGITLNQVLRRSFGLRHCDVEPWSLKGDYFGTSYSADDHLKLMRFLPHIVSIAGHHVKPHSDLVSACPDVDYFTFLRDPVARTASHYQHVVRRMGEAVPLEEWIKRDEFRNVQTMHIAGRADLGKAIEILNESCLFVGLVDRFDESLVMMRKRLGDARLDIRYTPRNVAVDASMEHRLMAEPSTKALLQDANTIDEQLYDYVVDELYERQRREFGSALEAELESFRIHNSPAAISRKAMLNRITRNLYYKPVLRYSRRRH